MRRMIVAVSVLLGAAGCDASARTYTDSTGASLMVECDGDSCKGVKGGMECGGEVGFQTAGYIVACASVNGGTSDLSCRPLRCENSDECSILYSGYECLEGYCQQAGLANYRIMLEWLCLADVPRTDGDCETDSESLKEVRALLEETCPSDGEYDQVCPSIPEQCSLPK